MLDAWQGFFQASAAAAATLAGLLVVAISINLNRILQFPNLPKRAAAALVTLGGVMALSLLGIVPGQPQWLFGAELLVGGGVIWFASALLLILAFGSAEKLWVINGIGPLRIVVLNLLVNQAQTAPLVIAGALAALGRPGALYWMAAGVIATLIAGILNAWVLLIEILR